MPAVKTSSNYLVIIINFTLLETETHSSSYLLRESKFHSILVTNL